MNKKSTLRSVANDYLTHPSENKGITLIALVITIIVLLILAGVSISMLSGDNGLLKKAGQARDDTIIGEEREQVELAYISAAVKKLGDDVTYQDLQDELDTSVGTNKTKVTKNANNTLNVLFKDTEHNYNVNDGKVAKVDDGNGGNDDTTTDLAKLQEYYSKGPTVFLEEDMTTYKNVEPITDATSNLKDIAFLDGYSVIKYKTNLYKVQFSRDPWTASVSSINIDLNTFGVYDIGGETNVLVTPSTSDNLIHTNFIGPTTFSNMYYYDNDGNLDYERPFTEGYRTTDNDGNYRYYDTSGALVHVGPEFY